MKAIVIHAAKDLRIEEQQPGRPRARAGRYYDRSWRHLRLGSPLLQSWWLWRDPIKASDGGSAMKWPEQLVSSAPASRTLASETGSRSLHRFLAIRVSTA